jgi:hypothetical protein
MINVTQKPTNKQVRRGFLQHPGQVRSSRQGGPATS